MFHTPQTKGAKDKPPEAPLVVASRFDSVGKTRRAQRKNASQTSDLSGVRD